MKTCITSVAFNPPYVEQLHRQYDSIKEVYGSCDDVIHWEDVLPPGSRPFLDSLYGFKPYAVKYAREKGYDRICFLDPACIVMKRLDYLFEMNLPVIAVKDSSRLVDTICSKALRYYGMPEIGGWHLVGGSLIAFDFSHPDADKIFNHWMQAEKDNVFGSQWEQSNEKINGHRNDESCLAISIYSHGYEPVSNIAARYNYEGASVIKKHFK